MMQKYKVSWMKLGDGHNAYFQAIVKKKNKQTGMNRM